MSEVLNLHLLKDESLEYLRECIRNYFGDSAISSILEGSELLLYEKDETVLTQDEEGSDMYLVISGVLDAIYDNEGERRRVGSIGRGECLGEMALLGNGKRTASVLAHRNSILLRLDKKQFQTLANRNSELALKLSKTIIKRLEKSNRGEGNANPKSKYITVLSRTSDFSAESAARTFKTYWNSIKQVYILREEEGAELSPTQFALLINNLENYDYVIMIASENSEWNRRIDLNADKTIYFAKESEFLSTQKIASPEDIQDEDELFLCYAENESAEQVAQAFKLFRPERCFKLRPEIDEDKSRCARIIAEEQICMVFGGGGAHGLSNLGVVKAFMEKGIPIDVIGGTSIGSIFAASLAMDWPFDYVYSSMEKDISKNNPLKDYTLPLVALLKGNRMRKMLKNYFNLPMQHTWKNMFCIAANLSSFKTEIIQTGPLDKAIASSISIPGILPPSLHNHSLLIDGGVLNNMPSDIMRRLYKGHVISVDVVASKPRSIDHEYKINNWQFVKNVFTGSRKNYIPGTMSTIMKAVTLASAERYREKEAVSDYYIMPRSKKGFLAWKEMDDFVESGYSAAIDLLKEREYRTELNLPATESR